MSRALICRVVYQSCRHEVPRSFLAVSGTPTSRHTSTLRPHLRGFSAVATLRSDRPPASQNSEIHLASGEDDSSLPKNETTATTLVPWYLQEEPPIPETRPVTGDQIPDSPENSPKMLPVLLEYVYKDLGLDSLKVIDLRSLDTPAALGAKTIMVIGTARSVKHLNVSADRLCRWLRSTYKLSPFADGLLGRNELKIKLRRKAKRARAASHAGTMIDEKDDGITTGWICVNAGVVGKDAAREQLSDAGFEGFGQVEAGTSVVVQIFTEEKRADIDLEGLWQATLDRAERKRLQDSVENSQTGASTSNSTPFGGGNTFGQTRCLHTSIGSRAATIDKSPDLSTLAAMLPTSQGPGTRVDTDSLLEMLVGLPYDSVRKELGTGPEDQESTIFLRLLHHSLSRESPPDKLATLRLRLYTIAVSRQHPAYTKEMLSREFLEFLSNCYSLSDELAFQVVAALLTPRLAYDHSTNPVSYLPEGDINLALQVLDRLHFRGVPILTFQVFNMLYQTVETPRTPSHALESGISEDGLPKMSNGHRWTQAQRQTLARLSKIVSAAEAPFDETEARQLMETLFRFEDYDGFWHLWRMFPLKGLDRTPEDYTRLFQLHADLGAELRARECLSVWVPMMDREATPIPFQGPVVDSILRCLRVADPDIETQGDSSPSYFQDLWTRCQQMRDQ